MNPDVANTKDPSHWALIKRLLGLTWHYRWACLRSLGAQLALLLTGILAVGLTGQCIDTLRHAVDPSTRPPQWPRWLHPPESWSALRTIEAIVTAMIMLAVLRVLLGYCNGLWFSQLLQGRLVVDLRTKCYDKLQRLEFRFFDTNSSSSLINRVGGDIQNLRLFIDGVLFQIVTLVVSVTGFLAYMLAVHVKLTLACLATTPLIWMASAVFSHTVRPAYKKSSELFDALVQRLAESVKGVRVVKAFARETAEKERFEKANDNLRNSQHLIFKQVSSFVPAIQFMSEANIVVLLAYGGWLAVHGEIGIGTGLVGFAAILQQFSGQVASIGNITNSMQQCLRASARVFEVLDTPVHIQSPASPKIVSQMRGDLRFEDVTFSHAGNPVLQQITLHAAPGRCLAIVGPTGSGKSAFLSLIPRFYDPAIGRILLDGIDLRELDLASLRRSVGIVFQDNFLFSTTVAENIAFGHPDASREQIEKAARIACVHHFINALPEGYDTVLGEAGVGLSGGQKQRIALARAILLEPAILILDDPTAAVDPETEHEIAEAMEAAMKGRTTFLVAHRPAMLRRADHVVVFENGRITQTGTHQKLLSEHGYYRKSAILQGEEPGDGQESES